MNSRSIAGMYCERKPLRIKQILLSEEIFTISNYCVHKRKHTEVIWIPKCVLGLIFVSVIDIAKFKDS